VYVLDVVKFPVLTLPDISFVPDQSPPAVQDVASVELQLSVEDVLYEIVAGEDRVEAVLFQGRQEA